MINTDTALDRVSGISLEDLRAAVVAAMIQGRLLGGFGVRDEQPEDAFVALLQAEGTPVRAAILNGCRDVCARLTAYLVEPAAQEFDNIKHGAAHFAAMLSATQPPEMQHQVRALFEASLNPEVPAAVRDPLIRIAVAYVNQNTMPGYWVEHLQKNDIPGEAFQALMRINSKDPKLVGYLADLWRRSLRDEINLRVPFAVDRWSRSQQNYEDAIDRVIKEVISISPGLRELLLNDIAKYKISSNWKKYVPENDFQFSVDWVKYIAKYNTELINPDRVGGLDMNDICTIPHIFAFGSEQKQIDNINRIFVEGYTEMKFSNIFQRILDYGKRAGDKPVDSFVHVQHGAVSDLYAEAGGNIYAGISDAQGLYSTGKLASIRNPKAKSYVSSGPSLSKSRFNYNDAYTYEELFGKTSVNIISKTNPFLQMLVSINLDNYLDRENV